MRFPSAPFLRISVALSLFGLAIAGVAADGKDKPSLSIRALPLSGFAPLKVSLSVTVTGGADDYREFYCPAIEWDWGDGTKSQEKIDCDPYEPGKSEIRRAYRAEHRFEMGGDFRVQFRLKQKNKTVASTNTTVRVQPGIRDGYR